MCHVTEATRDNVLGNLSHLKGSKSCQASFCTKQTNPDNIEPERETVTVAKLVRTGRKLKYSGTWELGTPKGLRETVLNSEVVLFFRSICAYCIRLGTEVAVLNSQGVRFHCTCMA